MCLHKSRGEEHLCGWAAGLIRGAANAITGRTGSTRGARRKPNGGLNSLKSNQDADSKRSPNGKSFDPEMTIQMIKVIGVHAA